jgi:hypothetical protein
MTPHAPCMRCQWPHMHHACSVIDTTCILNFFHAIAVLHMIFTFWSCLKILLCMWCQWHAMHPAAGVNDTSCPVHAVSITPHASCIRCQWHPCIFFIFFWALFQLVYNTENMVWLYWSLSHLPRQELKPGTWVSKGSCFYFASLSRPKMRTWFVIRGVEAHVTSNHPMSLLLPPSSLVYRTEPPVPCNFKNSNIFANSNLYSKRL